MSRSTWISAVATALFLSATVTHAFSDLPQVRNVQAQPLAVHVMRMREALAYLGRPLVYPKDDVVDVHNVASQFPVD